MSDSAAREARERDREATMLGTEAMRVRDDGALWAIIRDLERHATDVAISSYDRNDREGGRMLALAIRALRQEIQDRIDTALNIAQQRLLERASE
jgi:hypothetical protein